MKQHKNAFNNWKCSICGNIFRTRRDLTAHRKEHTVKRIQFCKCFCQFCGRESTTKAGNTLHEKYCKQNEKAIHSKLFGCKVSDETKAKWKANGKIGGYRKNAGRGKRGYYKGLYCMSSWELAWVVYQLEHGNEVQQCTERFEYIMNGEVHHYTPDFKIGDIYIEIKNWHRPDTDFKIKSFPKEKMLILIEGKENNKYINYVTEKYGKNFCNVLYGNKDVEEKRVSNFEKLKNERWEIIQSSNIDFSKFGWVKEISKLFGIAENRAGKYIEKNFPDFYKTCFKKRGGLCSNQRCPI